MRVGYTLSMLFLESVLVGSFSFAAPPEGKGPDKEPPSQTKQETPPGQQDRTPPGQQDRTPPGQERAAEVATNRAEQAAAKAERAEAKAENRAEAKADRADNASRSTATEARVERQHPHQERRAQAAADRADNANKQIRLASAHGRSGDHGLHGRDAATAHVDSLLKSLNKLDHARWAYNPHDTRGQGNMGKVDMRTPYGFDKDSGREGADRGRPIRAAETIPTEPEPTPNPAELTVVDFQVTNWGLIELQLLYNLWLQWADWYSTYYPDWFEWANNYYQIYCSPLRHEPR